MLAANQHVATLHNNATSNTTNAGVKQQSYETYTEATVTGNTAFNVM